MVEDLVLRLVRLDVVARPLPPELRAARRQILDELHKPGLITVISAVVASTFINRLWTNAGVCHHDAINCSTCAGARSEQ